MARWVRLTVIYDMDDPDKPLADELADWIDGNVTVADIQEAMNQDVNSASVSIKEINREDWI